MDENRKLDFKINNIAGAFDLDRMMVKIAVGLIIIPIIVFLWGWTRPSISIFGTILLIILGIYVYKEIVDTFSISLKSNMRFWIISIIIISFWCLFSGIGKFSYQTGDFKARNAFFYDLCYRSWPISFDISKQPEYIQSLFVNVKSANLVYYYTWWLPVALLVKIFNFNSIVANSLLMVYTITEVFIIYYCLLNIIKRYSYLALSTLILFGGFDFWIYCIEHLGLPKMEHIEWWATYFSYSSNTTQLYWVFNSSLPIWLIVCLIMMLPKSRCKAALGSLSFAYNPFAAVTMFFIVLADVFGEKCEKISTKVKGIFTVQNTLTAVFMLIVFGSYYLQVNIDETSTDGLIFQVYPEQKLFTIYLFFILIEIGIYFIVIGVEACKDKFYWVTLVGLTLIPLIKVGSWNDWSLKSPVPLLFIIMILVIKRYYMEKVRTNKFIILVVLFLGYMTAAVELQRNISGTLTMSQTEYTWHKVKTFEYITTGEKETDALLALQYLAPKEDNIWSKYITKK